MRLRNLTPHAPYFLTVFSIRFSSFLIILVVQLVLLSVVADPIHPSALSTRITKGEGATPNPGKGEGKGGKPGKGKGGKPGKGKGKGEGKGGKPGKGKGKGRSKMYGTFAGFDVSMTKAGAVKCLKIVSLVETNGFLNGIVGYVTLGEIPKRSDIEFVVGRVGDEYDEFTLVEADAQQGRYLMGHIVGDTMQLLHIQTVFNETAYQSKSIGVVSWYTLKQVSDGFDWSVPRKMAPVPGGTFDCSLYDGFWTGYDQAYSVSLQRMTFLLRNLTITVGNNCTCTAVMAYEIIDDYAIDSRGNVVSRDTESLDGAISAYTGKIAFVEREEQGIYVGALDGGDLALRQTQTALNGTDTGQFASNGVVSFMRLGRVIETWTPVVVDTSTCTGTYSGENVVASGNLMEDVMSDITFTLECDSKGAVVGNASYVVTSGAGFTPSGQPVSTDTKNLYGVVRPDGSIAMVEEYGSGIYTGTIGATDLKLILTQTRINAAPGQAASNPIVAYLTAVKKS